jgi:hypothetical protein
MVLWKCFSNKCISGISVYQQQVKDIVSNTTHSDNGK